MIVFVAMAVFFFVGVGDCSAQDVANLEARVTALEEYVETIPPMLTEFSANIEKGLTAYATGLEKDLQGYTQQLQMTLARQQQGPSARSVAVLDVRGKGYQRLETTSGTVLVAVDHYEPIAEGVRLVLHVGNPSSADLKNFKIQVFWGQPYVEGSPVSYDQWRQSLSGAEYSFEGVLRKGMWNPVVLDVTPANPSAFGYLECSMDISSIELQMPQE